MKRCVKCGRELPLADFYKASGMRDGHRNDCKTCNLAAQKVRYDADPATAVDRVRRWREANRDHFNAYQRARRRDPVVKAAERAGHLQRKFGITLEQYEVLSNGQGGCCAICKRPPRSDISLHVDHDHETGRIRGLLCFRCNNALGDSGDTALMVLRAVDYLATREEPDELATARARALALKEPSERTSGALRSPAEPVRAFGR